MATAPSPPLPVAVAPTDSVWRAPLVPAALAYTAGVVLDRYAAVPIAVSLLLTAGGMIGWLVGSSERPGASAAGLPGAGGHSVRRRLSPLPPRLYPADDVGEVATAEPRPVQMRGFLDEEPLHTPARPDPLRSIEAGESTTTILRATALRRGDDWTDVSGRVHLMISGPALDLHAGDEVEAVGRLSLIPGPANPGEADAAAAWRNKGVRAELATAKTADGVTRLERGWPASFAGWTAAVRGWGRRALADALPPETAGTAAALDAGRRFRHDAGGMGQIHSHRRRPRPGDLRPTSHDSGGRAVVGAAAVRRASAARGRRGRRFRAGLRPADGRPAAGLARAVAVCAACGALVLRRRTLPANLFALSWLAVALVDPTDIFTPGCQLSFLSVAVLQWGVRPWLEREPDPLQRMIDEARPAWLRLLRGLGGIILKSYLLTLVIWLAVAPLAAAHYHLISPIGILLGPPLVLLTAVALIAGFLLLAAAALCPPLTAAFSPIVHGCLSGCQYLVDLCDGWPGARFYVGDVPSGGCGYFISLSSRC